MGVASLAALASGTVARADDTANVSSSSSKSLYDKISEKFGLTYFGIYRGASLSDPTNVLQPDTNGVLDDTSPQSLESYITASYKFNKNLAAGISMHTMFFPSQTPSNIAGGMTTGLDAQMLDPSLMISRANLIDNGNGFHLKGMLFAGLPLTSGDYLQKHNMATSIAPTYVVSWDVPKTKLNLGVYGYVTAYVPTSSTAEVHRDYKLYMAPNAAYSLSDKVQATMWIDLFQVTHMNNTPFIAGMDNATMDIEPGINWDINKYISVNPLINIYPSKPTLAASSIQAVIVGKAF